MASVEIINQQIDYWLEKEAAAQRSLDYCQMQLEKYIGMKTLRLVECDENITPVPPNNAA